MNGQLLLLAKFCTDQVEICNKYTWIKKFLQIRNLHQMESIDVSMNQNFPNPSVSNITQTRLHELGESLSYLKLSVL